MIGWMGVLGQVCQSSQDLDRHWLDPHGRWVLFLPRSNHPRYAEVDLAGGVQPWVLGPHVEERLCNEPYVIFSRSSPNWTFAGSKFSATNSLGEDLKDWNLVFEGLEKGVEAQLSGDEIEPDVPDSVGIGGTTRSDSRCDRFLSSAEITAETICGDGVQT
jgi:hypothetical protein